MSGGEHSQGAFAKLLIEPGAGAHTFDGSSLAIEFLSETMSDHGRMGGNNGIRGTLRREAARTRQLTGFVFGEITMYVSPNDLDRLALNVFGMAAQVGTPVGSTTFTLDDTLPYFGMLIDTDSGITTSPATFQMTDCMISDWELSARAPRFGEEGEPEMVLLRMGIIGSSVGLATAWPGSAPAVPFAEVDRPYQFADSDSGITLSGAVRAVQAFKLKVDMKTFAKYTNSLTAHSHRATARDITAAFQLPWNDDNDDLYNQAVAGAAGSLVFTNGAFSSTFNLGRFQVPNNTPIVRGKTEVPLNISGIVGGTGSTADLVLINDTTP